ncbi:hypothetical protein L1987_78498 [Smallanthus sonchifolius]|uniref:Uncharacterized protein n=1 Tax=Smallanthus sonchifolius TaxID=185202 RepID=A0ACB8ZDW6_9ASTR|nr:hypothetical protein L1987_78498 [Smallanthus sonchifolius]
MAASSASKWVHLLCTSLLLCIEIIQCSVTYDNKSLIINGHRRILFSGSIHYPRSSPQMWEDLIQKAKDGGGFPVWLKYIENEYGADTEAYGAAGHAYMTWAAKMAVGLNTGVPWVMCKQNDAPDPIAHVFSSRTDGCAAFLANYNINSSTTVTFRNSRYDLPPWSISILPDCKTVTFNTAQVRPKTSFVNWLPTNVNKLVWQTFNEDVSLVDSDSKMTVSGLLDQLSVTRDASDYLWYSTSVMINPSELHQTTLRVQSEGHALHVFINSQLAEQRATFRVIENGSFRARCVAWGRSRFEGYNPSEMVIPGWLERLAAMAMMVAVSRREERVGLILGHNQDKESCFLYWESLKHSCRELIGLVGGHGDDGGGDDEDWWVTYIDTVLAYSNF